MTRPSAEALVNATVLLAGCALTAGGIASGVHPVAWGGMVLVGVAAMWAGSEPRSRRGGLVIGSGHKSPGAQITRPASTLPGAPVRGGTGRTSVTARAMGNLPARHVTVLRCESCGAPADLRLDDGGTWCISCDVSARRLGYDNRPVAELFDQETAL